MKKWQQMVPNIERKYPKLVGHKSLKGDKEKIGNLNKLKRLEIIPSMFSNHSGMKLETPNMRKLATLEIRGNEVTIVQRDLLQDRASKSQRWEIRCRGLSSKAGGR